MKRATDGPMLARLRIYPVRGLEGMDVDRWRVDAYGLRYDRRWMIVDVAGKAVGRGEHPGLAEVEAIIEGENLVLNAPHLPSVQVPLDPEPGPTEPATIRDETVAVRHVSADANRWLSEWLRSAVRLVFLPEEWSRQVDPSLGTREAQLAFHDELPLRILCAASVADLGSRLGGKLPWGLFRPSMVIEGVPAYDEDTWKRIRIGGEDIDVVKLAAMGPLTAAGVDPAQAAAVAADRTLDRIPRLGVMALTAATAGELHVGDTVEVLERREPPVFNAEQPPLASGSPRKKVRIVKLPGRRSAAAPAEEAGPDPWEEEAAPAAAAAEPEPEAGEPDLDDAPEAEPASGSRPEPEQAAPPELAFDTGVVPDPDQVQRLLLAAAVTETAAEAERLAGACLAAPVLVTVWKGETLVGLARGWTDGVRDGFLADVAVHPDHQGSGAAAELVRRVVEQHPEIRWVLRASPGSGYLGSALGWTHAGSGWYLSPR